MIYITLYLIYALFVLFIIGSLTQRLFAKLPRFRSSTFSPDPVNTLILGIIALTTLVSFISIIYPITPYVHIGVLVLLLLYAYGDRKYICDAIKHLLSRIKSSPYLFTLGSICLFSAMLYASGPVTLYDTGLYHAQAVKWLNEYGAVPGLGNLHHRLAFNSSWFCFSAFFDIMAFDGKISHIVNLIVFLLGLSLCFSGFSEIFRGNISISNILKCFFALPFLTDRILFIDFLPSLSPDLLIFVLILYVTILAVKYVEQRDIANNTEIDSQHQIFILLLCTAFFLPTVKLNSLPVLLFPFFIISMTENRTMNMSILSCLVGIMILLPFLIRNVILSGYLVFPLPEIDLLSFDWKIPYDAVVNVRKGIKYFAVNPQPGAKAWAVAGMSTMELAQFWLARNLRNPLNYWLVISFISATVFHIICLKRKLLICLDLLAIKGILLLGIVYWFFSAPLYRFGKGWLWGFIILSLAVSFYLVAKSLRVQFVSWLSRFVIVLVCVALMNVLLLRWESLELIFGPPSDLLWKIRTLPKEKMRAVEIHEGFVVNIAPRERAWNADLPSSPYLKYHLRMRGSTLKEGFRVAK